MVLAPSVAGLFKWRQFEPEVILLAVGWYLRFSLSYRDVEELLADNTNAYTFRTCCAHTSVLPTSRATESRFTFQNENSNSSR